MDQASPACNRVIHRREMPGIGDAVHRMGWIACSSPQDDAGMSRRHPPWPGVRPHASTRSTRHWWVAGRLGRPSQVFLATRPKPRDLPGRSRP
ncbi:selenium-binding protein SBP56-related protein [Paralimibaculum aggregatum]|uniref:selenium-binding protein SBP56-related protein n=1 Tax=Paralimibaculum aggregatum TaxID=3036245 RepID=UPI002555B02F|nr:selenium-binding protein SBP56-related protein [Limibaculum sp. NKW23]